MKTTIKNILIGIIAAILGFAIGAGSTVLWVNHNCGDTATFTQPGDVYHFDGGRIYNRGGFMTITSPNGTFEWDFTAPATGVGILNEENYEYGPLVDVFKVSSNLTCIRPSSSTP